MFSASSILKKLTLGGVIFVMLFGMLAAPLSTNAQGAALRGAREAAGMEPAGGSGTTLECGIVAVTIGDSSIAGCMAGVMYNIMSLFAWLMGAAAMVFSASVYWTVVQLSVFISGLTAISSSWSVLRDLANILLLFGFIAIGVMTILDSHEYGAKRLLPKLLIAAVMLNFSLFITKAIVDVGNVFAIQFYKPLNGGNISEPTFNPSTEPISSAFMEATGLTKIYEATSANQNIGIEPLKIMFVAFMGIILFVIGAFVFLALAFVFIARIVTLIFLMIVSPVGFVAGVIPGLSDQGSKWWKALINNALLGPIVMLCLLISINVITKGLSKTLLGSDAGGGGWLGWLTDPNTGVNGASGLASWSNLMLVFITSAGFMMASIIVAKQLSTIGAGFAMNMSKKVVSFPFSFASRPIARGLRGAGNAVDRAYNQSLSRRSKFTRSALRTLGIDDAVAAVKKSGEAAYGAKVGGFRSSKEIDEWKTHREHDVEDAEKKVKLRKAIATNNTPEIEKILQSLNAHSIEEAIKAGSENEVAAIGKALSPERFEEVMKNKDISENKKHAMQGARFTGVDASNVKNLSNKDLEQFAKADAARFETLMNATGTDGKSFFKEDQLETLGKSNALSSEQRRIAKANTTAGRIEGHIDNGNMAAAKLLAATLNPEHKEKLSPKYFSSNAVIDTFEPGDLNTLMASKKLNPETVRAIITRITDPNAGIPIDQRRRIRKYFEDNEWARGLWQYDLNTPI
ncbi:MAG: hypothetical protein WAV21_03535 [Minisyncoccia bacterium]